MGDSDEKHHTRSSKDASPSMSADPAAPARGAPTPRFHEKREALLHAAVAVFNERGVRGATLADIAARVGLVTNSVTYYYRKKEDLAVACVLRALDLHEAVVAEAAAAGPDTAARVRCYLVGHAAALAAVERGERPDVMQFNDLLALPSPQVDAAWARYTNLFRAVRGLLQGPQTAALDRRALNARGHLLLSAALWLRVWLVQHEPAQYVRAADRAADVVLHGVLAGAPRDGWPADTPGTGWSLVDAAGTGDPADAFLRAATALVNEQGYRGASVERISARLNVTKGSFYHHHDTKEDVVTACFERSFAALRRALVLADAAPGSGARRTTAALRALVRFQRSADGPLLRASATSALPDQARREGVRTTLLRLTQRLAGLLVDGLVDGSVRPLDTQVAAHVLMGGINAASELPRWVADAAPDEADALYAWPLAAGLLAPTA